MVYRPWWKIHSLNNSKVREPRLIIRSVIITSPPFSSSYRRDTISTGIKNYERRWTDEIGELGDHRGGGRPNKIK